MRPAVIASSVPVNRALVRRRSVCPRTAPLTRREGTDAFVLAESTEPNEPTEPIENAEAKEPTDPIESAEPTDPIERNEPLQPTERNDLRPEQRPCTGCSLPSRRAASADDGR